MTDITQINDGDEGLDIRGKLNDLIDKSNSIDTDSFVASVIGKNLIDKNAVTPSSYVEWNTGALAPNNDFSASEFIEIDESTEYYLSSINQIAFYATPELSGYISGIIEAQAFSSVVGAKYIRVTIANSRLNDVQLELGSVKTYYEPFQKLIPANKLGGLKYNSYDNSNVITVRENGTAGVDCNFSGINSIQDAVDSITDASESNQYTVFVHNGVFRVTNSSQFKGNLPSSPAMICLKDYVSLEGESEKGVILYAELPENDIDIDTAISRDQHQTIFAKYRDSKVSKCTIIGKNIRYTNHSDSVSNADSERIYENVTMVFKGTKGFLFAWGCGTFSGEKNKVIGGSTRSSGVTFSTHNNTAFEKPSKWEFNNHDFYSQRALGTGPNLENNGSLQEDEFFLNNCRMNNCFRLTYNELWLSNTLEHSSFNHAEWRIKGSGNSKILFDTNINEGLALRVTALNIGDASSVLFDRASSAFDILIKDWRFSNNSIITNDRFYSILSGYRYFEGSTDLPAYAIGGLDISDGATAGTFISLGKRLGDCSVTSKTLGIIINGITYNVVFNEDCTAQTNAYVIAQINAVISGFGVADEYCFGKEYYPEFTDVLSILANNQASYIPKGKIVTEDGAGGIKIADDGDKILGVAIENIPTFKTTSNEQYNTGRFVSNCYIYDSFQSEQFFVLCSKSSVIGEKYSVSNGELVLNASGTITPFKDGIFEF